MKTKNKTQQDKKTTFNSTMERLVLAFLLSLIILMLTAFYFVPEAAARICAEITSDAIQILSIVANILMPTGIFFLCAFIVNWIFGIVFGETESKAIMKTKIIDTCNNFMNLLNLTSFNALMFFKSPKKSMHLTTAFILVSVHIALYFFLLSPEQQVEFLTTYTEKTIKVYLAHALILAFDYVFIFISLKTIAGIYHFVKLYINTTKDERKEVRKAMKELIVKIISR